MNQSDIRTVDNNMFVHLADLHLAPRSGTIAKRDAKTNRLIRDLDMSKALERAVDDIIEQDPLPSTVVIAGDVFDTYQGSQDAIIECADQIKRLRDNGISVVGIAGNHDTPTQKKKTPAFLVLKHEFEDIASDNGVTLAYDRVEHVGIGNIEYVLLPHSVCLSGDFDESDMKPALGLERSVLVVHGVAAGDPSLKQMDEMKEIPIAKWILDLGWDYIAFGHYHKPGWIPGYEGKAAYCGSLENTVISGPDVCMRRGPVYVSIDDDGVDIDMHPQKIRRIITLPDIDVKDDDINAEELDSMIDALIKNNDTDGAIVLNTVHNVPKSVIRTMSRRNFQASNPKMLFIRTKIESLEENDNVDNEIGKQVAERADSFSSLNDEVDKAIDELIGNGTIRKNLKNDIKSKFDEMM